MSQENMEIVRRVVDATNRGDFEDAVADVAPEFEFVPSGATIPGFAGVHRGPAGLRRFIEGFWSEFDGPLAVIHELVETGDQVFASATITGRGKNSGAQTSWNVWIVWTVRDGRIVRGLGFTSRDRALEAAGLSE